MLAVALAASPADAASPIFGTNGKVGLGVKLDFSGAASNLPRAESAVGRRFNVVRVFRTVDEFSLLPVTCAALARKQTLSITIVRWWNRLVDPAVTAKQYIDAKPGSALCTAMVRWAQTMRAIGRPVYVTCITSRL